MFRGLGRWILVAWMGVTPVAAQETAAVGHGRSPDTWQVRPVLGFGRLFNNDALGDGEDRWRTGSYTISQISGPAWRGTLPGFGEILEVRLRGEIIASSNLRDPGPGDRRYAGILALGLHTHFSIGQAEASLGADLVVTGPQTGLGAFQTTVHEWIGAPVPGGLGEQISNGFHPTMVAEFGRSLQISDNSTVRPFVELRAGDETLARIGADLAVGGYSKGSLMLRDTTTGQRYRGVRGYGAGGMSLLLGGDIAHVADSIYLPDSDPLILADTRTRLRAGLHWQGTKSDIFWGLTWLSKEFDSQPEGQLLGSLTLRMRF